MSGAARDSVQDIVAAGRTGTAEFLHITDQVRIAKDLRQFRGGDSQTQDGPVTVHFRRDRWIECELRAEFRSKRSNAWIVLRVLDHQDVRNYYLQAVGFEEANGTQGPREGIMNLSDGIVHFRTVRVNADLDRVYAYGANALGLRLANQDRISLELDAECQIAGVFQNVEQVFAEQ